MVSGGDRAGWGTLGCATVKRPADVFHASNDLHTTCANDGG